ncbi:hypothetical protein [Cloacibacillus evryensis]|nr:hypothetical protein [Cloacibacillus evryensis]MCQ4763176.1 hypothetical protein [Cloacibacillus evryensis]
MLKVVICDDEDFYIGDVSRLLSDYAEGRPELGICRLGVYESIRAA